MEDTFTSYDGSEFTVLRRPTNPRGALEMRFRFVPDCGAPPPHVHPDTHETFAVEEGEFELHDPHHDFEAYLRKLAALTHELRAVAPRTPRAAMKMARLWAEHPDLIRPADAPMKVALPALGVMGRLARV